MKNFTTFLNESSEYKKVTVEFEGKERHIQTLLSMLKTMEGLGHVGSSRTIKMFVDGDGAFKLRVKIDKSLNIEPVEYEDDDIEFTFD